MDERRTSQQIKLRDGRMLGYAEYGPSQGKPVFYFHGFPSSRLDWQLFHDENTLPEQALSPIRLFNILLLLVFA